jgi:hypothetical protein
MACSDRGFSGIRRLFGSMSIIIWPTNGDDLGRKEVLRGGATGVPDVDWGMGGRSGTTGLGADGGTG